MMSKISVKGKDMHELYRFLTEKSKNGLEDNEVQWNFQKYLLDENGVLVKVISPRVLPNDSEIINWITGKSKITHYLIVNILLISSSILLRF